MFMFNSRKSITQFFQVSFVENFKAEKELVKLLILASSLKVVGLGDC